MKQVQKAVAVARSVLLLAAAAACSDLPVSPGLPLENGESAPSFSAGGRSPRDVPAVRIDLPPAQRSWDRDPAALEQVVASVGGFAVVAFKEPGSARALETGNRGAVTAGTVRAGLELLERNGVEVLELLDAIGAARVRMSGPAAAEIARHPLIDFVEPRQYLSLQAQTTPWGITMVGAPTFWATNTGSGAKIEIIDTGHQQNHVDLPAVPTANCAGDYYYGGCEDGLVWHGTHVLGIVAARNNTDGVVGVAPGITGANTFIYAACDSYSCAIDEITAGINAGIWNAHIINMSLGGTTYDAGMATAVANAWSAGIVLVAAAGNNLSNVSGFYPAAYTNVVAVSGVNSNKSFAASGTTGCGGYSNYGSHVDISAPFSANSTIGINTYGVLCGTSMAAPHVTGVAALLKSQNPTWTNQQIVNHLFSTAEDRGTAGRDDYFGYGIVRIGSSQPLGVTISGPDYVLGGTSNTWTANPTGGNGTYTYQWQYSLNGSTWSNGATTKTYTRMVGRYATQLYLRVTVTSNGASATSATYYVEVEPQEPMCGQSLC
ncbi:MAG TPA: S8 family serine peptidase [Longimicrobium sp.]|nr:S8 family serine peptidase [Longimicrobium sp.]